MSRSIVSALNKVPGACARKVHGDPYGSRGEPDIDCVYAGRAVKLEVKRPGTEAAIRRAVTPHQGAALRRYRDAGAIAGVVCSAAEALAMLGLGDAEAAARCAARIPGTQKAPPT